MYNFLIYLKNNSYINCYFYIKWYLFNKIKNNIA